MAMRTEKRNGFTLIELLVVISLIAVVAALGIAFLPNVARDARAARGASLLQGWLQIARQRAVRDRAPRGIRLYIDSGNVITTAEYIEQPDDLADSTLSFTTTNRQTLNFPTANFTNGFPAQQNLWSVQPGDFIEVFGSGQVHSINGVAATTLTLDNPLPFDVGLATSSYRIIRQPRVSGEDKLELPTNVIIDLNSGTSIFPGSGSAGHLDILFSPRGDVIQPRSNTNIILYVRDRDLAATEGSPSLIVVYTGTGYVGSFPVDTSGADRYSFVEN